MCKTILLIVLYGYEIWFLTLIKEHKLQMYENKVLRKVFGPRKDEVSEQFGIFHNDHLCDVYRLPSLLG